jgi:hypothetical protein
MTFRDQLIRLKACSDAVEWVGERTLEQAWADCERGDWMLWLAARAAVRRQDIVLAACDCARLALRYVPEGEHRPRVAIATAEAWAVGVATMDEVRAAYAAAYAAYAAAAAADAAAAYAAAAAASRQATRAECAALVRARISVVDVATRTLTLGISKRRSQGRLKA